MKSPENTINKPAFWRDSKTLKSTHFDDVYFNTLGGLDESNYVFIEPNLSRHSLYANDTHPLTILELGLGTGLNLLLTLRKHIDSKLLNQPEKNASCRTIHYIAIEKYPLQRSDIQQALLLFPELDDITKVWLDNYPVFTKTISEFKLTDHFHVTILPYDSIQSLDMCIKNKVNVDAIYLDGFSPAKNPDMWSLSVMQKLAQLSNSKTTFSSFTAASFVRNNLLQAGFNVQKRAGFGKKREMILGHYEGKVARKNIEPWLRLAQAVTDIPVVKEPAQNQLHTLNRHSHSNLGNNKRPKGTPPISGHSMSNCLIKTDLDGEKQRTRKTVILGAGFAGITTALKLLNLGFEVTLIEKNQVASGASGNDAGLAYPVIDRHLSDMTQFSFNAFQQLNREFEQYWQQLSGIQRSEIRLLPQQKPNDSLLFKAFKNNHLSELRTNKRDDANLNPDLLNESILINAFLVKPKLLCNELISMCQGYRGFRLVEHAGESTIQVTTDIKLNTNGNITVSNKQLSLEVFDDLVLANAHDAQKYSNHLAIGTDKKYGQVTSFSSFLKQPLSMRHYFVPIDSKSMLVGANYLKQHPCAEDIEQTGQLYNKSYTEYLKTYHNEVPQDFKAIKHRVSARMTTIDRYPIIGQLPNYGKNEKLYQDIAKGFRVDALADSVIEPNVWLNVGYGSKGFTHAVWGAGLLADMMTQTVCRTFNQDKVNPMRHLIRKLKKTPHK